MKTLSRKDISVFAPYKLEGTIKDEMNITYISEIDMLGDELITFKNAPDVYFEEMKENENAFKPHLWSIDYLNKEIEHNGERFVPIERLRIISGAFAPTEDFKKTFTIGIRQNKVYGFDAACVRVNQYELFEKLKEWHINFIDIPDNLFINKATINP